MSTLENAPVSEGEILDGKYRVDRVIGVGGMGVVVAATHVQLQTQVALKFLLPEVLSNPQVVERFVREARAAVQIQSEHVARVSDVGTLSNGAPYMVMEYLEGQDLADVLSKGGPLPVVQAVGHVLQACEAIAEAHALGIVHRDLKPANLFLVQRNRREPIIKVLDFGISKTADSESLGLTKTSAIMGSPYYMSPEQMRSARDADTRSDIWALGIILFELLTGVPPFQGNTITEVVVLVTQGNVPPIRDLRPDVPIALGDVISRCLRRDPGQRYADIVELAKALVPFGPPRSDATLERISRILGAVTMSGRPVASPEANAIGGATGLPIAQATAAAWSNSRNDLRSNRSLPLLIGIGVVLVAAITIFAWRRGVGTNASASASMPAASIATISSLGASEHAALIPSAHPDSPVALASAKADSPVALATSSASPESSAQAAALPPKKNPVKASSASASKSNKPTTPITPAPPSRGLNMGMKE
jgi:serine/threonine-protein kinase